jgi:potassium efflux system protein
MKSISLPLLLTFLLTLFLPLDLVYPADPPAGQVASQGPVTEDVIKAKIKEVESSVDLDKGTKAKLTNRYRIALSNLEMERSNSRTANEFLKARKTAPEQTKKILKKLELDKTSSSEVTLEITQDTPLLQIEQLLLQEEANLAAIQAKLSDAEKQLEYMLNRPAIVQERLIQARKRQAKITDEIKIPAPKAESALETEVRNWILVTEELALRAEIKMLDRELLSQPMRIELLKAQIDQNTWEIQPIEEKVHKLQENVNEQHLAQAEKSQEEVEIIQQMSKGKHSLIQMIAEQNAALSQDISLLATHLEGITNRKDDVIKEAERLQDNFQRARQTIGVAGMDQILGRAFTEQYQTLQKLTDINKATKLRANQIAEINLARIQYNEERRRLKDIPSYVAKLAADLSTEETSRIQEELKDLAEKRQKLINQALLTQRTSLQVLNELDAGNRQLLDIIKTYSDFLAKYLLWIRNASFPKLDELLAIPDQINRVLSPANWREAFEILKFQVKHSALFILLLALVGVVLWRMKRLRSTLEMTGREVGQPASDRFIFTVQALGLTLLMAAPWPMLLALLGWQLNFPESAVFTQSISTTLLRMAGVLYFLQVFRILIIPKGLAAVHLRWSAPNLQRLRLELRWFMGVFLPIYFIGSIAVFSDYGSVGGGLGRISIMALLITIAVIFYRVLRPRQGIVCGFLARYPASFLTRFHHFWFALVLALPLGMAVLNFSGYVFSSGVLFARLYRTVGLISVLVIFYFLAVRWVLAALSRKEFSKTSSTNDQMQMEEPEIDNTTLNEESNKLISNVIAVAGIFGLWFIWSDMLPALGILNNIVLWYYTDVVSGVAKNLPVTLGDAGLAIIVIFLLAGGLKHFSTFQEIVLRQFTSMRPSARYAFITLSSYAILATSAAYVFSLLGGSWKEIQWIFAALGVGIGFGLQEIVANFICGLIILFERPVRIGDVVTVGDIEGTVSRIQIRATTITMFDKKELLVPNKEFITGRLVNWSLSDPMTRIMVYVQVAYGSDIQKTMSIMSNAAEENACVLKNPTPFVTIEGFVDNRLKLNLRCYIGLIENRLRTVTALHEAIIQKFKEAGIVVPAPQQDLNLNTGQALDIHSKQGDEKPGP